MDREDAKRHEDRQARRPRRGAPQRVSSLHSRFVLFAKLRGFAIQTPSRHHDPNALHLIRPRSR